MNNPFLVEWSKHEWTIYEAKVYDHQRRIYESSKAKRWEEVWELQRQIIRQPEAKLLAVKRVTQENTGKKTPGVDGVIVMKATERCILARSLKVNNRASPIRRVYIPKPGNKELRPLGIPTIRDRAKQALVKMALEPQWEGIFTEQDWYSFGFRPGRCADDARKTVARWCSKPKYVLDADIRKCFDMINHEYLLKKINCNDEIKQQIEAWLKAGILENLFLPSEMEANERGTPQGGVISPLLANIALCGMQASLQSINPKEKLKKIGFARYADDFVVLTETKTEAETAKDKLSIFLKEVGLEFSEEKTRILKSTEGFDFLGFTFKTLDCSFHHAITPRLKRRRELLPLLRSKGTPFRGSTYKTKPSLDSVRKHRESIRQYLLKNASGTPIKRIIQELSFKIKGWTNYFCTSNATQTFSNTDAWLFKRLFKWATKRCKGNRRKAFALYFSEVGGRKWNFGYKSLDGEFVYLRRHDATPILARTQIKKDASPYDGQHIYWIKRLSANNRLSKWARKLIHNQGGLCGHCKTMFYVWDIVEVHHLKQLSEGGTMTKKNLMAVHITCHDKLHSKSQNIISDTISSN